MAIKLAFSTVACPDWTLEKVAREAKAMGYTGVELRTLGPGSSTLACDPALTTPQRVRTVFTDAGVDVVCLSTSISLDNLDAGKTHEARLQTLQALEQAAAMGCPAIRVFCSQVPPGQSRQAVMQHVAQQANMLADTAAALGIRILFENAGTFATAKHWWWLLNLIENPTVGLCWNAATAAAAGEVPAVSVPTLNSRIVLAKVKDTKIGEGSGFVPLGEGTVGVERFVQRLLGVGFSGYVSVEWDRAWLPTLAPAEEYLPDAAKRLQGWLTAIAEAGEGGKGKKKPVAAH